MAARILVIEDNPANLQLLTYLLRASGQTVLSAVDGQIGLDVARREHPDLIVCDLQMPVMDGYEVARQVRNAPALRHLPLVAVTAYAMDDDRAHAMAAGFDGYIAKPIVPETVVSQLLAFLTRPTEAAPPRVAPVAAARPTIARPPAPSKAKICVVDNCLANLAFARSALEPIGYEVVCVISAHDALPLIREIQPDLIACDVHMPRTSGLDVLRLLKNDAHLQAIPTIMITSCSWGDDNRRQALELGAAKFLVRPMEPQQFLSEIQEVLEARSWVPS